MKTSISSYVFAAVENNNDNKKPSWLLIISAIFVALAFVSTFFIFAFAFTTVLFVGFLPGHQTKAELPVLYA